MIELSSLVTTSFGLDMKSARIDDIGWCRENSTKTNAKMHFWNTALLKRTYQRSTLLKCKCPNADVLLCACRRTWFVTWHTPCFRRTPLVNNALETPRSDARSRQASAQSYSSVLRQPLAEFSQSYYFSCTLHMRQSGDAAYSLLVARALMHDVVEYWLLVFAAATALEKFPTTQSWSL